MKLDKRKYIIKFLSSTWALFSFFVTTNSFCQFATDYFISDCGDTIKCQIENIPEGFLCFKKIENESKDSCLHFSELRDYCVIGLTGNAFAGAIIHVEGDRAYYFNEINYWPKDKVSKQIKVTGKLIFNKYNYECDTDIGLRNNYIQGGGKWIFYNAEIKFE